LLNLQLSAISIGPLLCMNLGNFTTFFDKLLQEAQLLGKKRYLHHISKFVQAQILTKKCIDFHWLTDERDFDQLEKILFDKR